MRAALQTLGSLTWRWLDSSATPRQQTAVGDCERIDWGRILPFVLLHLSCLLVFAVGWSWVALAVAVGLYWLRMFGITAFYHRYFAHRAFKTSRLVQFLGAFLGNSSGQRGPLWWAAHHRTHHKHADTDRDVHSLARRGFLWSHVGWFASRQNFHTDLGKIRDFAKYPELRFLDRFDTIAPLTLAAATYGLGSLLAWWAPELGTSGLQMVVWGFCVSTTVLFHATSMINSLAHKFGTRRYPTRDLSRNNLWLALLTMGEGWHNNHHHYPVSARQGFRWWEIDLSYYLLALGARLGLVQELRPVPARVRDGEGSEAARG